MTWDVIGSYLDGDRFHFIGTDPDRLTALISKLDSSGKVAYRQVWKNGEHVPDR